MPSSAHSSRRWIAVLGRPGAELPAGPLPTDRIALLSVRSPSFPAGPAFVATTGVTKMTESGPRLRHRVNAPEGYAVPLRGFAPPLAAATGWTDTRLAALAGHVLPITEADFLRIEAALLAQAHAHGPAAKRPSHARPRTPGRRALIAGRAAVRGARR